jgi:hypothetical protein
MAQNVLAAEMAVRSRDSCFGVTAISWHVLVTYPPLLHPSFTDTHYLLQKEY